MSTPEKDHTPPEPADASGKTVAIQQKLEQRLSEAWGDLWDYFVDPLEAFCDDDGLWMPVATAGGNRPGFDSLIFTAPQLWAIRLECRLLAATNEFAINGHENRISYLVGAGHSYRATIRKGHPDNPQLVADAQTVLDRFILQSQWHRRQQEIVRRLDRDGEVFLRFFTDGTGDTTLRFVEPDQVMTPAELAAKPAASFGILTDEEDVETVLAYFVDGRRVPAAEIQHRKANVDTNVKRGLPLFFPVRKNLRRAEKLLRNMSIVAEIQSAIALIRKHEGSTKASVQQFVSNTSDANVPQAGRTMNIRRFGPGTILDAPSGVDYDFPASGLDAGTYVTILQAELRAIASRLVMPEFMLTSDASNSNYASTMVAEGPAMRMFSRLQADLVTDDVVVMWRVLGNAAAAGQLPANVLTEVDVQIWPPSLAVRDQKEEVEMYQIEYQNGILSPQTWSQRRGLDYGQEQANIAQHAQRPQEIPAGIVLDPITTTVESHVRQ